MSSYEITQDDIVDWANNYASLEELEATAKAVYSIYVQNRKATQPEKHLANKKARKRLKKKPFRYPKGYRKYEKPLEQKTVIPTTEYRK
jgi:hypothetical protein